jgi:hypothetical protein
MNAPFAEFPGLCARLRDAQANIQSAQVDQAILEAAEQL